VEALHVQCSSKPALAGIFVGLPDDVPGSHVGDDGLPLGWRLDSCRPFFGVMCKMTKSQRTLHYIKRGYEIGQSGMFDPTDRR
jgi:hypothetical protein